MPSPSDHYVRIYSHQAEAYHRLITAEDVDNNLLPAIEAVAPLKDARLLDLGSGTGRIPILTHTLAAHITALDLYSNMLVEQKRQRDALNAHWSIVQSDMRQLPIDSRRFDIVTVGWALGHFPSWYPNNAKTHIARVLDEMTRVCKPGGALIILETLTTGSLNPAPPTEKLAAYYGWLENEFGFTRQEVSTDYQFNSLEEAVAHTEFFFGPDLAAKIRRNHWTRLPEWTGLWYKTTSNQS